MYIQYDLNANERKNKSMLALTTNKDKQAMDKKTFLRSFSLVFIYLQLLIKLFVRNQFEIQHRVDGNNLLYFHLSPQLI
jgi:hypothetical protein